MREIAAELGMHVGNLYYYFRNKEELLAFCQQDALAGLTRLARRVRTAGLPVDEQLRKLMIGHVVRLNEETPGSLAHLEVEAVGPAWRSTIQRQRDDYERVYRDLLAEGVARNLFRPVDPKVASMAILGALNWTVKWFRAQGGRESREIGEQIADLVLGGLRRSPERDRKENETP